MSKIVDLTDAQKQEVLERMNKRLNGELGLDLSLISEDGKPLVNLIAQEVDFSVSESEGQVIGITYSTTVTENEEPIGLHYTEVRELWLYQMISFETNRKVVENKVNEFKKSKDYDVALKYLNERDVKLVEDSQKVINIKQVTVDEDLNETTEVFTQGLTVDFKNQNEIAGYVAFNENILIQFQEDEDAIVFIEGKPEFVPLNENKPPSDVTTYNAGPKWRTCMARCLGCGSWQSCVKSNYCILACAACVNPLLCAACLVCAVVNSTCLWRCRMCVPGAARPNECPN